MAMNMLPTKEGLINKLCDNDEEEYLKAVEVLPKAVGAMNKVYDITQELFKENKLLDLPWDSGLQPPFLKLSRRLQSLLCAFCFYEFSHDRISRDFFFFQN